MWPFSSRCQSKARLNGRTVVITGANTGIGKETARDLYWRGARVILACRNLEKANEAVGDIRKNPPSRAQLEQYKGEPGQLVVSKLNLASLASVRECAKKLTASEPWIHVLINNAGVMMTPQEKTMDGFELQLQSNHLGHFYFTLLLLPKIRASAPGTRIVNVSSTMHTGGRIHFDDLNLENSYSPMVAYQQSKLANILFTKELARKIKDSGIEGVTTYSLHPGLIATEIGRNMGHSLFRYVLMAAKPFSKSPELGAQTSIHCAVDETAGKETGLYYKECKVSSPASAANSREDAERLWEESLKLVGLPQKDNLDELLEAIWREILI